MVAGSSGITMLQGYVIRHVPCVKTPSNVVCKARTVFVMPTNQQQNKSPSSLPVRASLICTLALCSTVPNLAHTAQTVYVEV